MALKTIPNANVTVTVTPDAQIDLGLGAGVAMTLNFTPDNALTPQTIIVAADDDQLAEGDHLSVLTHLSASADAEYDSLMIGDIVVTIVDDDAPTIHINEIDSDTASIDMLEFVELFDGGVGNASLTGKTVVFYNGNGDVSYAAFDLDGFSTDENGFFVLGNALVDGVDLTFSNNFLQNGADAVALFDADATSFPNGTPVTVNDLIDAIVYDTGDGDDPGLLPLLNPGQPQVNEDDNGNKDLQSLARMPDAGIVRDTNTFSARTPTPNARNTAVVSGVAITQSGGRTDLAEGGATDSYLIALDTFPTEPVTITVDPDDQLDLGPGPGIPITLVFSPGDAIIPQTVTVTAVDDNDAEGNHSATITHTAVSADVDYAGIPIGTVIANITDNEVPVIPSIVISEIMYNPSSDEISPGIGEWIEVVNTGRAPTDLSNWLFDDEDASNWGPIPAGTILAPQRAAVFFDGAFTTAAEFRSSWSVPATALVVGLDWGSLANSPSLSNEALELLDSSGAQMDLVNYDDAGDWPPDSPEGPSIYLTDLLADNNVGTQWARSVVGTAGGRSPAGGPFSTGDVGSPGSFPAFAGGIDETRVRPDDVPPPGNSSGASAAGEPVGNTTNRTVANVLLLTERFDRVFADFSRFPTARYDVYRAATPRLSRSPAANDNDALSIWHREEGRSDTNWRLT